MLLKGASQLSRHGGESACVGARSPTLGERCPAPRKGQEMARGTTRAGAGKGGTSGIQPQEQDLTRDVLLNSTETHEQGGRGAARCSHLLTGITEVPFINSKTKEEIK